MKGQRWFVFIEIEYTFEVTLFASSKTNIFLKSEKYPFLIISPNILQF